MTFEFTGKIYECPKCGREIEGYIEDVSEGEYAGCANCLDCWKVDTLKDLSKEVVQFT